MDEQSMKIASRRKYLFLGKLGSLKMAQHQELEDLGDKCYYLGCDPSSLALMQITFQLGPQHPSL